MAKNGNLHKAKDAKNDEFYTRMDDISNELRHYKKHFKGKTIYCNCDDPTQSNFFHYFSYKFRRLGLKKLIATCYKNQERDLFSQNDKDKAICLFYDGGLIDNRIPDPEQIGVGYLWGDGDFRSEECIELLKDADIVVTNPPFSLFREYLAQLIEHDKKFLIIGNMNAITYKEVFPLIKEGKIWLGCNPMRGMTFDTPSGEQKKLGNVCWFTNLPHRRRNEELILTRSYSPEEYPKYDNYDAIHIKFTREIPYDYDGAMGVPISFLDKHNPDQFEIMNANDIRLNDSVPLKKHGLIKDKDGAINGKPKFARIVIRRKGAA